MDYYTRSFEDDEETTQTSGEPRYEFAGFEVVSSDKVALIAPGKRA